MTCGRLQAAPATIVERDRLVRALVVVADANRLQRVAQLFLCRRVAGVEGLLIAPDFEDARSGRAVRSARTASMLTKPSCFALASRYCLRSAMAFGVDEAIAST